MSHIPADEQKAATFVPCLSQCSAEGRSPFPAFSPPEPAYFGCACPILQRSLALLPRSRCWDLAAATTSPARAEGPIGLPIKSSFFCLRADTGVCLGQDCHSNCFSGPCWPRHARTFFFERTFLYIHVVRADCNAGPVAPNACRQCQQDSCNPGFPLLHARPAAQAPRG